MARRQTAEVGPDRRRFGRHRREALCGAPGGV